MNSLNVGVQIPLLGEGGWAEDAEVRFLPGMSRHVSLQHHLLVERLAAICALKGPDTCEEASKVRMKNNWSSNKPAVVLELTQNIVTKKANIVFCATDSVKHLSLPVNPAPAVCVDTHKHTHVHAYFLTNLVVTKLRHWRCFQLLRELQYIFG